MDTPLIQACQPPTGDEIAGQQVDPRNVAPPGGAIRHDDPFYIERAADTEVVYTARRRQAETLIIKAPRQMGKSTLLKRYLAECQALNQTTVLLDFSMFTPEDLADYPTFLTRLVGALWDELGQPLQAEPPRIDSQRAMISFIGNKLLEAVPGQIALAFDEADKLLGYDYQTSFFSMLRYWHERRSDTPPKAWARTALALVISTEPYLLINDSPQSPFNVTPPLELRPFSEAECRELNRRYDNCLHDTEVTQLMELVGGHPFLVRLAYHYLTHQNPIDFSVLLRNTADRYGPFGIHLRAMERKLMDESDQTLLAAIQQVVHSGTAPSRDIFDRLNGAGLVHDHQGQIVPANQLYARFFGGL